MTPISTHPTLTCPAKLNLFLEISGKRTDGYHELGTLFQAVEFGDTLYADPWDCIAITGDAAIPGPVEDNLIYKAAELLRTRYADRIPLGKGIRFTLEKRIPMGAGLGGGSSDAAAALRLANQIWEVGLSHEELRTLAPELGSDVAFFLFQPTAFAEGRGEVLSPAPRPFPFHIVLATPHCHVETAWAYRKFSGQPFGRQWQNFKAEYAASSQTASFYSRLHNDFEEGVTGHFEEIRFVRNILKSFDPTKAMLTGSGSSLFALFRDLPQAQACLAEVAPHCRFSTITRFQGSAGI
jgi:4-diphosphocytidyl-2-C-methyl-D-erythritol kinase